jgi:hypothetical protein
MNIYIIRTVRKTVALGICRAGHGTGILCATAAQAATAAGRATAAPATVAIARVDAHVRPGQEWCLALNATTGIVIGRAGIACGRCTRTRVGRHESVFELRFGIDRLHVTILTTAVDTGTDRAARSIVRAQAPLMCSRFVNVDNIVGRCCWSLLLVVVVGRCCWSLLLL